MKKHQFASILIIAVLVLAFGCSKAPSETKDTTPVQTPESPPEEIKDVTDTPVEETPGDTTPGTPPPAEEETPVEDVPLVAESETKVISLKDLKAYPEELHIKPGTTVEWRNINDKLQHIIGWSGQKGEGVKPEPILMGESWSFTFNEPRVVKWYSTARPTIQGTIYIEEE